MRDTMLILHFLGLVMGLGTSFAHAFLGGTISKLQSDEARKFRIQINALGTMGSIGTLLLLVSGIYLILPFWPVLFTLPLLLLKLFFFVILLLLLFLMRISAKQDLKNNNNRNLKRTEIMGKLTLIVGIIIVIIAVNIFH